jgi:hypothetical protein
MPNRFLFATFVAAVVCAAAYLIPSTPARAACGTGYVERLDRRGDPFCMAESKLRALALKRAQMMRRKQLEWKAELIRDRQTLAQREREIERARRARALN